MCLPLATRYSPLHKDIRIAGTLFNVVFEPERVVAFGFSLLGSATKESHVVLISPMRCQSSSVTTSHSLYRRISMESMTIRYL